MGDAALRWKAELEAWAIPDEILAAAPEPPWGFPHELFHVGDEAVPDSPSRRRALDALPQGGTVLDVGCGGGRAALALTQAAHGVVGGAVEPRPGLLVGVDESAGMLAMFAAAAGDRGVPHEEVLGSWPAVAPEVAPADVVVCHHVLYNVPDVVPFVQALAGHARRRVVLELTDRHPMVVQAPLWQRFHGIDRPSGPSADDACAVLAEAGIEVGVERHGLRLPERPREMLVGFVRRRLCLPASREAEIDEAMGSWNEDRDLVTLWWDTGRALSNEPATP